MNPAITPIRSSTQAFLETEDVRDDIIILKDGSCALVIKTTATNFGLLSEKEQDAEIYAYGALLNSLTFPIQILIRSKRKDISSYLKLLEEQENKTTQKKIKEQIQKYRRFIEKTVQVNNVLEKEFYLIIPMSFLEVGVGRAMGSKLQKKTDFPFDKEYIIEKAKANLHPKRDHLFRLFNRLGLKTKQLNTEELIKLLFKVYNQENIGQISSEPKEYQTPLVRPATEFSQVAFKPKATSPTESQTKPEAKEKIQADEQLSGQEEQPKPSQQQTLYQKPAQATVKPAPPSPLKVSSEPIKKTIPIQPPSPRSKPSTSLRQEAKKVLASDQKKDQTGPQQAIDQLIKETRLKSQVAQKPALEAKKPKTLSQNFKSSVPVFQSKKPAS